MVSSLNITRSIDISTFVRKVSSFLTSASSFAQIAALSRWLFFRAWTHVRNSFLSRSLSRKLACRIFWCWTFSVLIDFEIVSRSGGGFGRRKFLMSFPSARYALACFVSLRFLRGFVRKLLLVALEGLVKTGEQGLLQKFLQRLW